MFMFLAALFLIAKNWTQPKKSFNRGIDKQSDSTMKCYSAIKRNEPLIHTQTWMNLKCIVLSERSRIQKIT